MIAFRGINYITVGCLISALILIVNGQDRKPTISFITQPEIVTDIGGTIEMRCSVQVRTFVKYIFKIRQRDVKS